VDFKETLEPVKEKRHHYLTEPRYLSPGGTVNIAFTSRAIINTISGIQKRLMNRKE
jgi:hypothetical protein